MSAATHRLRSPAAKRRGRAAECRPAACRQICPRQSVMEWIRCLIGAGLLGLFPAAGSPMDRLDAPVITNLNLFPVSGAVGSRVVVRLHLYDRQGVGNVVPILYQIREGIEQIRVPIYDDGTHDDLIPGDNFFAGHMIVPRTASPGPHWFVVYVFDQDGNRSNLSLTEFTVTDFRKII